MSIPRLQPSIMQTLFIIVSCVYDIKIAQYFMLLGIQITANFQREIRDVAHSNG